MATSIEKAFSYHRPSPDGIERIKRVRLALKKAATEIADAMPGGAEATLAIRKLEECSMWANKAIVLGDPDSAIDPEG